jgi:hypothetical protein
MLDMVAPEDARAGQNVRRVWKANCQTSTRCYRRAVFALVYSAAVIVKSARRIAASSWTSLAETNAEELQRLCTKEILLERSTRVKTISDYRAC